VYTSTPNARWSRNRFGLSLRRYCLRKGERQRIRIVRRIQPAFLHQLFVFQLNPLLLIAYKARAGEVSG